MAFGGGGYASSATRPHHDGRVGGHWHRQQQSGGSLLQMFITGVCLGEGGASEGREGGEGGG